MDEAQSFNTEINAPISPTPPTPETPATASTPTTPPPTDEAGKSEPEISLDKSGELNVKDEFWGSVKGGNEEALSDTPQNIPHAPQAPQNTGYTDDELRNTPFEQWDEAKITGDVSRYIPFFKEQLARRRAQVNFVAQQAMYQQQTPQAPQPYTAKELSSAAEKLARERLKLDADDELDMYEPEHFAAMSQATAELQAQRQNEIAKVQRETYAQTQFGGFCADLTARSDFNDFDKWITGVLAQNGKTPDMLAQYVHNTGDYNGAQRTLSAWYQAYQTSKRQTPPTSARVPTVENAGNAVNTGVRRLDLRNLRDMNDEEQTQAFIDSGFAKLFMQ